MRYALARGSAVVRRAKPLSASSMLASAGATAAARRSPSCVSTNPRPCRVKSRVPNRVSNWRSRCEMAEAVTVNSLDAPTTEPARATALNAWRARKGAAAAGLTNEHSHPIAEKNSV